MMTSKYVGSSCSGEEEEQEEEEEMPDK